MIPVRLPRAALGRLWPAIAPFAEKMAAEMPDDWPAAELYRRAAAGILTLWAAWSPAENSVVAIAGTEIHRKPSGRTGLVIAMAAGRDHRQWIHLVAALERFGAAQGCDFVEIRGRPGWARLLPQYRAKPGVVLTKELP